MKRNRRHYIEEEDSLYAIKPVWKNNNKKTIFILVMIVIIFNTFWSIRKSMQISRLQNQVEFLLDNSITVDSYNRHIRRQRNMGR